MPVTAGLYYSENPSNQPGRPAIILLHGAGASHLTWPPLMRRLPGWRIIALDLPAHGRSEGPSCRSVADLAARVLDMLVEKGVFQAALVGHSLGGAVALQLALQNPNLIRGLGLICTSARFSLPPAVRHALTAPYTLPDALQTFRRLAFHPATPADVSERWLKPLLHLPPSTLLDAWQAADSVDLREKLTRMELPGWIAVGADDRLVRLADARFLAAFLPQAHLQIVPGAGHLLPLEQPRALSEGFKAFLARLDVA